MVAVPPLLSARIKDAGLDEYVRETGYLEHEEVISVMGGCDGLLLPSLGEGFPNTLLEGMACGIPVIATTVGSIPEVLSDGECGILVPPGDHVALSSAIERLIREEELRRRMGQNGLQTVRRRFTQRPALEGLRHSYHHLLNGLAGV
jgi:glycosyltransferase involved in cell wall biosynthesis